LAYPANGPAPCAIINAQAFHLGGIAVRRLVLAPAMPATARIGAFAKYSILGPLPFAALTAFPLAIRLGEFSHQDQKAWQGQTDHGDDPGAIRARWRLGHS
jgi:hypothetical protein